MFHCLTSAVARVAWSIALATSLFILSYTGHQLTLYNSKMVRLASVDHNGATKLVAQTDGGASYVDLTSIASNVRSFLEKGEVAISQTSDLLANESTPKIPAAEARLLIPLDPATCGKFVCIGEVSICLREVFSTGNSCSWYVNLICSVTPYCLGMNYIDHCTEQNIPVPEEPVIFNKFPSALAGPNDPVVTLNTEKLDYEVELGFIVGKTVPRNTTVENAKQYIGGYTVVHDVSARDWQMERNGGQWLLGEVIPRTVLFRRVG